VVVRAQRPDELNPTAVNRVELSSDAQCEQASLDLCYDTFIRLLS
jgi:hypothetical protein